MIMEGRTNRPLSGRTRGLAVVLLAAVLGVAPGIVPSTKLLAGPPQTTGNVPTAEPAEPQPKSKSPTPQRVATIDIKYLFKHYEKFRRDMWTFRNEVQAEQQKMKQRRLQISALTEQEIAAAQSQLKDSAEAAKKAFLAREAAIYYSCWEDIAAETARYAKERAITAVMRTEMREKQEKPRSSSADRGSPRKPDEVLARINAMLIYADRDPPDGAVDITADVLARLNARDSRTEQRTK